MNTTESNILIAEFMKVVFYDDQNKWYDSVNGYFLSHELKYDYDWGWLMEVVEEIDQILPDDSFVSIEYNRCFIPVNEAEFDIEFIGNSRIEATYNAIIEFIKFYNDK